MSNPPQTFSVKRKRLDTPVDTLIFDNTIKRQNKAERCPSWEFSASYAY